MSNRLATTFALSAAALFLGGCGKEQPPTTTPTAEQPEAAEAEAQVDPNKKVRCYGVNECAGETHCDVAGKWDCGGNNDCCGKGWLKMTKASCDELGGGQDESFIENVSGICEGKGEGGAEGEAPADESAAG